MKKLAWRSFAFCFLIAMPAFAADMAVKAPPPAASTPSSWSGFYAGIAGGLAWGQSQFFDADLTDRSFKAPITNKFDVSGGIFGATAGYNWQFNNWVAGVEGDFSWVTKQGITNGVPPFATTVSDLTHEHWLGTGRLRLGIVPMDGRLFYMTGGFAAAGVEAIVKTNNARDGNLAETQTRWGWTVGGGLEAALFQNWSFKLEYLFVGLQDKSYFPPVTIVPDFLLVRRKVTLDDNVFRVGLNYRFN